MNTVTNHYSVIATSCTSVGNIQIGAEPDGADADEKYSYPGGLTGFRITCPHDGDTATIQQYYYGMSGNEKYTVRKWKSGTGYITIDGARPLGQPIGDDVVFLVEYQITDGGQYDDDSEVNGVIVDPSGAALPVANEQGNDGNTVSATSSGLADTGMNQRTITTKVFAFIMLAMTLLSVAFYKKQQSRR